MLHQPKGYRLRMGAPHRKTGGQPGKDEDIGQWIPSVSLHITGEGAPQARPAGPERGAGGPASDGTGGSGGAKPPGLVRRGVQIR